MEKGKEEDQEPSVLSVTKAFTDSTFLTINVLSNMRLEEDVQYSSIIFHIPEV
jgi:hypothetical protein